MSEIKIYDDYYAFVRDLIFYLQKNPSLKILRADEDDWIQFVTFHSIKDNRGKNITLWRIKITACKANPILAYPQLKELMDLVQDRYP